MIDFNHDLVPSKLWEYLSKNNTGGQQIPSQEEIKHFIFDPANPAHSRNSKIDCGVHTIDWLRDEFCEQFKCSIPSNTFKEYWNSIFGKAKSEGIRCMKDLRSKGICIGICSNTNQSHWEFICKNFPEIRDTACDWFLSFELKSRKPDPMFYELISERTKTPSGNLLLFDDVEANVLGARHAGLKAELFSKTSTFDDVLKFVTGKFFDSCHPADACACLTKH